MNIYSNLRTLLSKENKGHLTRFLIYSGLKPTVNKKVFSPLKKGIVVFSADFEMAWAFRYSKTEAKHAVQKGLEERNNVPVLLQLFKKFDIPVTWATVGHLLLKECKRNENAKAHPEMPRPGYFENRNWRFNSGDWYDADPCSDINSEPAWYAVDLVESIIKSDTKHEMACHTFSHIDFTDKNCSQELANAELDACLQHAGKIGIKLKSMVFPGGTAGNFNVLKEKGFLCYRKPMKQHIDLPYIDDYGLVAIPSSLGLDKDPYGWSADFHLKMIRKYLDKATKYRLVCHFWFHPSMHNWYLENVLPRLVERVEEYRSDGKLEVLTMAGLAEKTLKQE
jgi:peptidoglycan/xylan/chitin deacetylase (PgdA/CDA1 family)